VIQHVALRRRLAWASFVILLCSAVASLRMHRRTAIATAAAAEPTSCRAAQHDSVRVARLAVDTIADLRARRQHVRRFSRTPNGIEVRTEDDDTLAAHDGGLAAFDCMGRLTFLWLDGG
jgi:hypothetical protein